MKSKTTAVLLWLFLGIFSVHRFYLGKTGSGILYLLTLQLFGIGWIIDIFLIGGWVEQYNTNVELKTIRATTMANATQQKQNSENKK